MGQIGNWGTTISFETSDQRILTFSDFSVKVAGNWSSHNVIGQKARSEFGGAALRTLTFTILLSASLGVRPRTMLERIEDAVEHGEVGYLVIGGRMVGRHRWKCTQMSETWDTVYAGGELASAKASLSMEEYL
ncbi:MAG: phage tail protein [Eubacteriales bacterium]|nr:phage tail protein [Eubacteriales bacterium]